MELLCEFFPASFATRHLEVAQLARVLALRHALADNSALNRCTKRDVDTTRLISVVGGVMGAVAANAACWLT